MKEKRIPISIANIFYISALLLAFTIPLYKRIVPFSIILFIVTGIVYVIFSWRKIKFSIGYPSLFSIILYCVYVISMLYTTNFNKGHFDLEVKLSLLIFPLLLSLKGNYLNQKDRFNNILLAFVLGTFTITLVCYLIAIYRSYTIFFTHDFFTYTYLANFHHPTYFAMFIDLSISILICRLIEQWYSSKRLTKYGFISLILYFIVFVFLLNSKAGIIIMLLMLMTIFSIYTFRRKKLWIVLLILFGFIMSSFITIRFVPYINSRFVEMTNSLKNIDNINQNTLNDSEQRILIWRYSADVIANKWSMGVGAGDVTSSLNKVYLENGFNYGAEKNLNCHNQFLQTFVATGISGIIILLLMLASILILAIKKRSVVLLSFFIIVTLNMFAESTLEVQAGTIFFGFFIAFLGSSYYD